MGNSHGNEDRRPRSVAAEADLCTRYEQSGPESQEPAFTAVATDRNASSFAASHRLVASSLPTWAVTSPKGPTPTRHLAARHRTEPSDRAMSSSGSAATSADSRRRTEAQPRRKAAVRRGQSGAPRA